MLRSSATNGRKERLCLTVDVEDWFHILDSARVPDIGRWSSLESRIERNVDKLLELFDAFGAKCTFFWLGWVAERHKELLRRCQAVGHEIACHGYAHVLAGQVGPRAFYQDVSRSKAILEDITGKAVRGFRSPGFGVTDKTPWAFDAIKEAGYEYDTSIFPTHHGHGGMPHTLLKPYFIETRCGHLLEIPSSVVEILSHRVCLFGGGYLRLATKPMIKWGLHRLEDVGQPSVIYVHPREIDPGQPRLPLPFVRRFKCYIRLKSTLSKLEWLCRHYNVCSMLDTIENYIRSFYETATTLPVVALKHDLQSTREFSQSSAAGPVRSQSLRHRILQVENAMATFLHRDTVEPVAADRTGMTAAVSLSGLDRTPASVYSAVGTAGMAADRQP